MKKKVILLSLILVLSQIVLRAQENTIKPGLKTDKPGIFQMLSQADWLELNIETDMQQLLTGKRTEKLQPAKLSYRLDGQAFEWDIEIKTRGRFRLMNCDFPPLELKFKKDDLATSGLAPFDELKLTTHCLASPGDSRELVLREYLAYRIYNTLTDSSFKVQLAEITYIDSSGKIKPMTRWAFVMESMDELLARLQSEECECFGITPEQITPFSQSLMAVFQFMIGNADWNVLHSRNIKLVRTDSSSPWVVIPHDFDFSALVGAPYAIPSKDLGQTEITQRIFLGPNLPDDYLERALVLVNVNKETLLSMIKRFKKLPRGARKETYRYLKSFYDLSLHVAGLKEYKSVKKTSDQ